MYYYVVCMVFIFGVGWGGQYDQNLQILSDNYFLIFIFQLNKNWITKNLYQILFNQCQPKYDFYWRIESYLSFFKSEFSGNILKLRS